MCKYEVKFYKACIQAIDKTIRKEFKHISIVTTQDDESCWHNVTVYIKVSEEANIELHFTMSGKFPALAARSAAESLRKFKLDLFIPEVGA